ncbi:MAG: hypothetical protein ACE5I7_12840 [Candidatus Binatia bacterium]
MEKAWLTFLAVGGAALLLAHAPRAARAVEASGVITGSVRFRGTPPPPKKMPIDKDNDVCGTGFRKLVEVDVAPDKSLRNVVVCVQGTKAASHSQKPQGRFKLDQRGCKFIPEVSIVPKGAKLKITNRDPVVHNIHTFEIIKGRRRDMFNFAQPERGHRRTETIKPRRGDTIELTCDVHTFMHGWIYVSDGSTCVVAKDGHFRINGVPDGTHAVKVWHPTLGEQEKEVRVAGGKAIQVDFEFANAH